MARQKRKYTDNPEDRLFFQRRLIINRLRQASRFWPAKKLCLDAAKEEIEIGAYKNGKPKFKLKYKCNKCSGLFNIQEVQVNHIEAVVDPIKGFQDWQVYIDRLFCESNNLETICVPCHDAITASQQLQRKKIK